MRWKQFLTPVKSLDAPAAKNYMNRAAADAFVLLDVRQPEEYEAEHLPGAKLIPLADLGARLSELDPEKPAIVYCAIGGRSRVASQVLAGKGFKEVFNLSGGIKAWNSGKAVGPEDLGLDLFTGKESPEETLVVAYGLEEGLRRFYESMAPRVTSENARKLFARLSTIEVKHQDRIFSEYLRATGAEVSREDFAKKTFSPAMEGGLTTEDYIQRYQPNIENPAEVISLAMAIEGQALDLYQRAADRAKTGQSRDSLMQIAGEERSHLEQLGKLFQNVI
ncbi:MAG TPA: rhodanese-like domain-containing protein [Desulfobacterales bacterium]|jgi:rhodanese-related sulfurtransferase/rubrerythrin|nr:rhodanese-like domain-containing protein [Desulfobacterales bacterium]HSM89833.1 rhodanese-like domain-containing protein [Desulfobacterales bacterium]